MRVDEVQLDQRCPDESERQLEGQTEMIRYGNSSYHLIWTRASSTIASAIESIGWCPEEDAPKNSGMEKDLGRAMEGNDASHERSSDSSLNIYPIKMWTVQLFRYQFRAACDIAEKVGSWAYIANEWSPTDTHHGAYR